MPVDTVKRNKRNQKWTNENRDRINLIFSKGLKEKIESAANADGLSRSQWVEKAIIEKLEKENIT